MDTVSIAGLNRKGACRSGIAYARYLSEGSDKVPVTIRTLRRLDDYGFSWLEWYLDYGAPEKVRARMSRKLLETARALVFSQFPEEAYQELHAVFSGRGDYVSGSYRYREDVLGVLTHEHLGFTLRGRRHILPRHTRLVLQDSAALYELLGQLGLKQDTRRRILLEAYLGRALTEDERG